MWKVIHSIVTGLIIALGSVHVAFTASGYEHLSLDALWFFSTGVAIILAGSLNVATIRQSGNDPVVRLMCLMANLVFVALFGIAMSLMRQLQVFVGVGLFAVAAVCVSQRARR